MLTDNYKLVHFIGIGGYGMSALALILLGMGIKVSGSDMNESRLTKRLREKGADVSLKHTADNIADCDLVVYSTAIPAENPEMQEARRKNKKMWHRSELLAELLNSRYGIAIAGTHGKTTTTAMLSLLLDKGGLDPTAVIGGEVNLFNGNARLGNGRYLVAEACESDNSFLRYFPQIALITNIEADHLEHYDGDFNKLNRAYDEFMAHIKPGGCLVMCGEDPLLQEKIKTGSHQYRLITYGVMDDEGEKAASRYHKNGFDYSAGDVIYGNMGAEFTLYHHGKPLTEVKLNIPGRHNVSNAIGALAAAAHLGVEPRVCAAALQEFTGANRRFEIVGREKGITVVDDYAHHPTEIQATIQAARTCCGDGGRIICIFQPHRYSRTGYFMDEFAGSFTHADMVLLHDVYSAGEKPVEGISSEILAGMIREKGCNKGSNNVHYGSTFARLAELACAGAGPGDMVITMGAGDIWKTGGMVLSRLQERPTEMTS